MGKNLLTQNAPSFSLDLTYKTRLFKTPPSSRCLRSGSRSRLCLIELRANSSRRSPLSLEAMQLAVAVRGHWGIENQLHWILDVGFREDQSRATQGYCAENLAVIRHLAVNLISQEKSAKGGTRAKRLKAGWDDRYLTKLLAQAPTPSRKL